MLVCTQKINFITHFLLKILQKNSKLVVLGNLGMSGDVCVYLKAKIQLHPPCFSGDIAKIFKVFILGTLDMSGYTHPKYLYQLEKTDDMRLVVKKQQQYLFISKKKSYKIFQKIKKNYFGAILGRFCSSLGKNEFSWKKWLC